MTNREIRDPTSFAVEVFCPHCHEALGLHFARPITDPVMSIYPRFDRTIQNVKRPPS